MSAGQLLRGLVSQAMRSAKPNRILQQPFVFPPGSFKFTAAKAGYWKFVMWGHGGGADGVGNGSGAYLEKTKFMALSESALVVVGQFTGSTNDSTVTFEDGSVLIAGSAGGSTPGVAMGGDVNLAGTAGSAIGGPGQGSGGGAGGGAGNGGAGAPALLPYRGGNGAPAGLNRCGHGAGSGISGGAPAGLILVAFMRS